MERGEWGRWFVNVPLPTGQWGVRRGILIEKKDINIDKFEKLGRHVSAGTIWRANG